MSPLVIWCEGWVCADSHADSKTRVTVTDTFERFIVRPPPECRRILERQSNPDSKVSFVVFAARIRGKRNLAEIDGVDVRAGIRLVWRVRHVERFEAELSRDGLRELERPEQAGVEVAIPGPAISIRLGCAKTRRRYGRERCRIEPRVARPDASQHVELLHFVGALRGA